MNPADKSIIKPDGYKCIMKVYKIKIVSFQRTGIWYTRKVGQEFYTVLVSRLNKSPVFRLIEIDETRSYLKSKPLILEVHIVDCNVIEEFIIKSKNSMSHLYL
jgi:curli biogenesis system outer membrane secretion channel CsgG